MLNRQVGQISHPLILKDTQKFTLNELHCRNSVNLVLKIKITFDHFEKFLNKRNLVFDKKNS